MNDDFKIQKIKEKKSFNVNVISENDKELKFSMSEILTIFVTIGITIGFVYNYFYYNISSKINIFDYIEVYDFIFSWVSNPFLVKMIVAFFYRIFNNSICK
ncbi:MAG: hypothetical protein KGV43_01730 [Arcobacter sp.]|nr:hypothetical protein [Arcobacter sp.]